MIEIKNITKLYKDNTGIKNISFNIPDGKITGLVGENGAGKTTIIKSIFNLVKLNDGEVIYNGLPIQGDEYIRLAFFPDSNNIPLKMKVKDFAIYNGVCGNLSYAEALKRVDLIFSTLNLEEISNKRFNELSAGLKKQGIFVATLVNDPEVIIMDEPTANLDVESREELMEIIKFLNKSGKTIMITSHIIDELEKFIDKLVVIKKGEIVYDELFDNQKENIIAIYSKFIDKKDRNLKNLLSEKSEEKSHE